MTSQGDIKDIETGDESPRGASHEVPTGEKGEGKATEQKPTGFFSRLKEGYASKDQKDKPPLEDSKSRLPTLFGQKEKAPGEEAPTTKASTFGRFTGFFGQKNTDVTEASSSDNAELSGTKPVEKDNARGDDEDEGLEPEQATSPERARNHGDRRRDQDGPDDSLAGSIESEGTVISRTPRDGGAQSRSDGEEHAALRPADSAEAPEPEKQLALMTEMKVPRRSPGYFDTTDPTEAKILTQFSSAPRVESSEVQPVEKLEESGIFVDTRPFVYEKNLLRMERRLDKENRPHIWFDQDKRVKALPNPMQAGRNRPCRRFVPNAVYRQTDVIIPSAGRAQEDEVFRLDVCIGRLELSTHALQSEEEALAAKLLDAFREYKRRERTAVGVFYTDKLHTLQENYLAARDLLKHGARTLEGNLKGAQGQQNKASVEKRVVALAAEIQELRELRDADELQSQESVKYMQELFQQIERVRTATGYQTTAVMLGLQKLEADADLEKHRREIEIQGMLGEDEDNFRQHSGDADAKYHSRLRLLEHELATLRERVSHEEHSPEEAALRRQLKDLKREGPPTHREFDPRRAEARIRRQFTQRRAPGEPTSIPVLTAGVLQDTKTATTEETKRRNQIQKARYLVQLKVNQRVVGTTAPRTLGMSGTVEFHDVFSLELLRWPEDIRLVVLQKGLLQHKFLVEVALVVPGADGESTADPTMMPYQFTSHAEYLVPWQPQPPPQPQPDPALKEGEPPAVIAPKPIQHINNIGGTVYVQSKWESTAGKDEVDLERNTALVPLPPKATKNKASDGAPGGVSMFQKSDWMARGEIDPNDPRAKDLLKLARVKEQASSDEEIRRFRLHEGDDVHLPVDGESKRQQLIKMRWGLAVIGTPETTTAVPLLEQDVNERLLDRTMQAGTVGGEGGGRLPVPAAALALSHMQQMQNKLQQFITTVKSNLEALLEPKKKLRPKRKKVKVQAAHPAKCDLLVNVQMAFHLPKRTLATEEANIAGGSPDGSARTQGYGNRGYGQGGYGQGATGKGASAGASARGASARGLWPNGLWSRDQGGSRAPGEAPSGNATTRGLNDWSTKFKQLQPFVEVSFQGQRIRTRTLEGNSPQWNQQLDLEYHPENNDYSPTALISDNSEVVITVFDEFTSIHADSRSRSDDDDTKIVNTVRRYLGSITLPISSIYRVKTLNGVFELDVPPLLLGYSGAPEKAMLRLYIVLKPGLAVPPGLSDDIPNGEDDALVRYAQKWQSEVRAVKACKLRTCKVIALTSSGSGVFLPRLVHALSPPPLLQRRGEAQESQMLRLLRLVSLVPSAEAWVTLKRKEDIWTTSKEFLDMAAGADQERAILLCNFFLYLGIETYVVLGPGVTSPRAAFVLTKGTTSSGGSGLDGQPQLWNASTGNVHSILDERVELRSAGMLFNEKNVWANIQLKDQPWEMSWDLENTKAWRPFFGPQFPARPMTTVQVQMEYERMPEARQMVSQLEAELEKEVMDAVSTFRASTYTRFNRRCSRILKGLLRDLEEHAVASGRRESGRARRLSTADQRQPEAESSAAMQAAHLDALAPLLQNFDIQGFPLNMRMQARLFSHPQAPDNVSSCSHVCD
ncbi:hypothetical protein CYMTET_13774 [Cymbomonas tetramitiformis]|uniref:C2 domain-containing protein n=1 Tax=Cymbomonas tetramitiformis TaxID=36881 RepID=A0AAE0GHE3_9CHLO|nr:hypothetical protein CYMTET_13774 [Cymbomonas tetramitiformis]